MPAGRPTKYTPEIGDAICLLLTQGNYLQDAAAKNGIAPRTAEDWIQRGEQGKKPYDDFARKVAEARAHFVTQAVRMIKAGAPNWKALAWLLERTRPRQFGTLVRVHVDEELQEFLERAKKQFDADVYEQILACAAGELGRAGAGEAPSEASAEPVH